MALHRTDGDDWVDCTCGERHWGRYGAAGLMLVSPDGAVLLQHRSHRSHHGDTWGLPGGAIASSEAAHEAALREATEEAAVPADAVRLVRTSVEDHGQWSYTTLIGHAAERVVAYPADPESQELRWVRFDDVATLPLHPGFSAWWPGLREQALRRLVLVVDGANVVGSRPDGWWKDRLGANARLRDSLAELGTRGVPARAFDLPGQTWWPELHLIVEGQASALQAVDGVHVHAAVTDGDSQLAATAAAAVRNRPQDHVVAVTADRALRASVQSIGVNVVGPKSLLQLLPLSD